MFKLGHTIVSLGGDPPSSMEFYSLKGNVVAFRYGGSFVLNHTFYIETYFKRKGVRLTPNEWLITLIPNGCKVFHQTRALAITDDGIREYKPSGTVLCHYRNPYFIDFMFSNTTESGEPIDGTSVSEFEEQTYGSPTPT